MARRRINPERICRERRKQLEQKVPVLSMHDAQALYFVLFGKYRYLNDFKKLKYPLSVGDFVKAVAAGTRNR